MDLEEVNWGRSCRSQWRKVTAIFLQVSRSETAEAKTCVIVANPPNAMLL